MGNTTGGDLLSEIISLVEALPEFEKLQKIDEDLTKLKELETAKKFEEGELASRLNNLHEKLKDSTIEQLEEISRERGRLAAEQSKVAGFLSVILEQQAAIAKERALLQHTFSEAARALSERAHKEEAKEVQRLVAAVEGRLLTWQKTADILHTKYFPKTGIEYSASFRSINFFAPNVKASCSMSPV